MTALADLDAGMSADQLVPGHISDLEEMVAAIRRTADRLVDLAQGIAYIELTGHDWSGQAAKVYAAAKDADITQVKGAAQIFDEAQQTIETYTTILRSARQTASLAKARYDSGRKRRDDDVASCTPPPPPVSPTQPYDPYGLQAAADQLDEARREVRTAARIAAPFLRELAAAAPWPDVVLPTETGPSLRDLIAAPAHLAHGLGSMLGNSVLGWAAVTEHDPSYTAAQADHYAGRLDAGTNELVPALALLSDLALMVAGARTGIEGEVPIEDESALKFGVPRYSNLRPQDPLSPSRSVPLDRLREIRGQFNYVVRDDGKLLVGRGGHIDLARGSDVLAAGEVKVVDGEVRFLDNKSGHYQPGVGSGLLAKLAFEQQTDLVIPPDVWKAAEH